MMRQIFNYPLIIFASMHDVKEIEDLDRFFKSIGLPEQINLDSGTRIMNVPKFVEDNIAMLKMTGASELAVNTRLWRIRKLKAILSAQ